MRHGDAVGLSDKIPTDAERTLSVLGRRQVDHAAEGLRRRQLVPEAIVSSPLIRARETAEILARVLKLPGVVTSPDLAPQGSAPEIGRLLKQYARTSSLLLVAHQPDLTLLSLAL